MNKQNIVIWIAITALAAFNVYLLFEVKSSEDIAYESEILASRVSAIEAEVEHIKADIEQLKPTSSLARSAPEKPKLSGTEDLLQKYRLEDAEAGQK